MAVRSSGGVYIKFEDEESPILFRLNEIRNYDVAEKSARDRIVDIHNTIGISHIQSAEGDFDIATDSINEKLGLYNDDEDLLEALRKIDVSRHKASVAAHTAAKDYLMSSGGGSWNESDISLLNDKLIKYGRPEYFSVKILAGIPNESLIHMISDDFDESDVVDFAEPVDSDEEDEISF